MARRKSVDLTEPEEVLLLTQREGLSCVVGIDEAGRGPLAGPVVAAAVCLPPGVRLPGVTDSKCLSPGQREECLGRILTAARAVGVGIVEPEEIDRINILRATHKAMVLALRATALDAGLLLVDGLRVPGLPGRQIPLVKGDTRSLSIAAASILAKVTRDRIMVEAHQRYPSYGFADHKGYYCPQHLQALRDHGPCPLHRLSFAPVRSLVHPEDAQLPLAGLGKGGADGKGPGWEDRWDGGGRQADRRSRGE